MAHQDLAEVVYAMICDMIRLTLQRRIINAYSSVLPSTSRFHARDEFVFPRLPRRRQSVGNPMDEISNGSQSHERCLPDNGADA